MNATVLEEVAQKISRKVPAVEDAATRVGIPERLVSVVGGLLLVYTGLRILKQRPAAGISTLVSAAVFLSRGLRT